MRPHCSPSVNNNFSLFTVGLHYTLAFTCQSCGLPHDVFKCLSSSIISIRLLHKCEISGSHHKKERSCYVCVFASSPFNLGLVMGVTLIITLLLRSEVISCSSASTLNSSFVYFYVLIPRVTGVFQSQMDYSKCVSINGYLAEASSEHHFFFKDYS